MSQCANQPYISTSVAGVCGSYLFMSLLDDYIRNRTDISGLCDRVRPIQEPEAVYDYIVIGGGSGGATAAGRLAGQQKWRVLLIEAGNDEPPATQVPSFFPNFLQVPEIDWDYISEPETYACQGNPERRCSVLRAKVLGGCSVLNGMMYIRGVAQDFQRWVDAGNDQWSYDKNLKYYQSLEDNLEIGTVADEGFHGTGGPLTINRFPSYPKISDDVLAAADEVGFNSSSDLNGKQISGFAIAQTTSRNGTRLSASKAFLWPQRDNPYLNVMLNTTATRIVFDQTLGKQRKRAIAVQIEYKGRSYSVRVRREVIVAGGTFNTPQVLMLSGIGPEEHLRSVGITPLINLPGVGQNFHNHVSVVLSYNLTKMNSTNYLNNCTVEEYFKNHTGPMSSTGLAQVTGRLNSKYAHPNGTWPDVQIFFSGFSASCGTTGSCDNSDSDSYETATFVPVALHPKSRGQILLRSADPHDPPLIYTNDLSHPDDVATLVDGIRMVQQLAASQTLISKYGIEFQRYEIEYCDKNYEFDTDEYWTCTVQYATMPENHQVGTCKMGSRRDPMAVVSQKLRVHGTKNVRIMDASVMPFTVSGNTAATIMMIAERGVNFTSKSRR